MSLPLLKDEDGVRWITLNRPEVLNALTLADLTKLADSFRNIGPEIRGIVLTGAGDRAFSAGMHLETFADLTPTSSRRVIEQVANCLAAIRLAPIPTVAMINGYCLGAAFEMVLACDIRVACPEAHFGLPEVRLGIPSVVDAALLPAYVGLSKAKEMILTGDLYEAKDLLPGFINRTAERHDLRSATIEIMHKLRIPTREVIAAQKSLFETWLNTSLAESIEHSKDVFAQIFESPATAEAIARYRQRN